VRERELRDRLVRSRGQRGVPALRHLLDRDGGPKLTRSEAERRMLAIVRRAGLPEPEVNATLHGYEVDFLWREQRVVVEVDSYRFHSDPIAFQRDRDRSNDLQLRGYTILRVTWHDLSQRPAIVAARLRRILQPVVGE
jgi:very-short-patch-repair endonuclease